MTYPYDIQTQIILSPDVFTELKETLPQKIRREIENRDRAFTRQAKEKEEQEVFKISQMLDKDTLLRFSYVPYVIASLAWDYADTVTTLCAMLKLEDKKKLCREVKNLRRDYDRVRSRYIDEAHRKSEEKNMYVFEEETKDIVFPYLESLASGIKEEYPDIDVEISMYLQSIYQCHIVLLSIYKYVYEITERVEAIVGHKIGDILLPQLRSLDKLVLQFAKDWPISDKFKKQHMSYAKDLSESILSIEFNDIDESDETTPAIPL